MSLLCFLSFKIPILLYLNLLDLPQETGGKPTVVSSTMSLRNQMLAIKLNAFNAQKCFVKKLEYQIWIDFLKHMNTFLGILLVPIAERTMKIINQ